MSRSLGWNCTQQQTRETKAVLAVRRPGFQAKTQKNVKLKRFSGILGATVIIICCHILFFFSFPPQQSQESQLSNMAADAQARLHINLQDVVTFYKEGGCGQSSLDKLEAFIEAHDYFAYLDLAEGFGKCMAFIDHDVMATMMQTAWTGLNDLYVIEKKSIDKRIKNMEQDKKADPDILLKYQNMKIDLEQKLARVLVQITKYKYINVYPLKRFNEKSFNPAVELDTANARKKELLKIEETAKAVARARKTEAA